MIRRPATFLQLVLLGAAVAGYACVLRPRILRWGATNDEVERTFPGDEIIPGAHRSATMAVSIDAPPSDVWPWLVQMGHDRGCWYSWDKLDNFGRTSTNRIHPEWQDVSVGDRLIAKPDGAQWWEVAALEPERLLCLRISLDLAGQQFDPRAGYPESFTDSTWGFLLEPLPHGRTRLIVSGYWRFEPAWLQPVFRMLLLEPSHWVMQMRQFVNLKRLAEST